MMQGSLAEKLRILRAQKGLTVMEASERIGINRHTLRNLERGGDPHYPTLLKIAKGYGVPVEELLEEPAIAGKGDAPEPPGQPRDAPTFGTVAAELNRGLKEARRLHGLKALGPIFTFVGYADDRGRFDHRQWPELDPNDHIRIDALLAALTAARREAGLGDVEELVEEAEREAARARNSASSAERAEEKRGLESS